MSAAPIMLRSERFVPMSASVLDQIASIEHDLYEFPWTRGNFQDSLQAGYSAWTLRDAQDAIIAYSVIMIAVQEGHLLNLSVARAHQGKGYGWTMLEWMIARAREYGAQTMFLEVRPSNDQALRLYTRYGFEKIGIRRGYYPAVNGREDAIVMRAPL